MNSVVASFPQGERVWLHSAYIASLGETDTERKTYTETERGLEKTEKQTQPREFIRKRAHKQLFREQSVTVVSAR